MNIEQVSKLHEKANRVVEIAENEYHGDLGYVQAHRIIKEYLDLPMSYFEKIDVMTELMLALDKANKIV